jgi:regulatory protein
VVRPGDDSGDGRDGDSGEGPGAHAAPRLATVSYLFGAPAPEPDDAGPAEDASSENDSARNTAAQDASAKSNSARSASAPAAAARSARDTSGWYVPPVENTVEPEDEWARPASGVEPVDLVDAVDLVEPVDLDEPVDLAAPAERADGGTVTSITFQRVHKTAADIAAADPERFELTPTPRVRFEASEDEPQDDVAEPAPHKRDRVTNVSLNALARRGMSSAEMTRLLQSREVEPDEVVDHVTRLEESGLLDDRVLAENLVRTLQERKGLGRSAISAELRRRQVDETAVAEAMEAIDTDDELARACEVAAKRASQLTSYDQATAKRRLGAYLQRRGYSGSILSAAMASALEGGKGSSDGPRFR